MKLWEIIQESIGTLGLNKMRTGLAMLGIIIGIGSVIALISLGAGGQKAIENQIQSLGANLLTITPSFQRSGNVRTAGSATTLTLSDAKAIEDDPQITTVTQVSPEFSARFQAIAGANNTNVQVLGVYPQYALVRKVDIANGVFISDSDINSMTKVAVLGPQVAADLFGQDIDPIGQTIKINRQIFRVIGLTESKGGMGLNNQDNIIFAPLPTVQKQLSGASHITSISVEVTSQDVMSQTQDQIGYLLLDRHNISSPAEADFMIISQNDVMDTASQITGTFTTLLSGIAAISLLVGGIGIMNIMLVTVTERTREIGLRKALGAKKNVITSQFLVEAIILTITGGVIGIAFGVGISLLLSKIMSLPDVISPSAILLSICVSGVIGIIFGWYPASRAAKLQPIEALRYE